MAPYHVVGAVGVEDVHISPFGFVSLWIEDKKHIIAVPHYHCAFWYGREVFLYALYEYLHVHTLYEFSPFVGDGGGNGYLSFLIYIRVYLLYGAGIVLCCINERLYRHFPPCCNVGEFPLQNFELHIECRVINYGAYRFAAVFVWFYGKVGHNSAVWGGEGGVLQGYLGYLV